MKKLNIDKYPALKKYINKPPSKKYIENLKAQSWYQLECVKCKISNRKWLEAGNCAFDRPIRMDEIVNKKVYKVLYCCDVCKLCWEG